MNELYVVYIMVHYMYTTKVRKWENWSEQSFHYSIIHSHHAFAFFELMYLIPSEYKSHHSYTNEYRNCSQLLTSSLIVENLESFCNFFMYLIIFAFVNLTENKLICVQALSQVLLEFVEKWSEWKSYQFIRDIFEVFAMFCRAFSGLILYSYHTCNSIGIWEYLHIAITESNCISILSTNKHSWIIHTSICQDK